MNKNEIENQKPKGFNGYLLIALSFLAKAFLIFFCFVAYNTVDKIKENNRTPEPTQTPYIIKEVITNTVEIQIPIIVTVTVIVQPTSTATVMPIPTKTYELTKTPEKEPTPTVTATRVISEYIILPEQTCLRRVRNRPNANRTPNMSSITVGFIENGQPVKVVSVVYGESVDNNNVWYQIEIGSGVRFVNSAYPGPLFVWSGGFEQVRD
jgi:hypothetical protein